MNALPKEYKDIPVHRRIVFELDRDGCMKIQGASVSERAENVERAEEIIRTLCSK